MAQYLGAGESLGAHQPYDVPLALHYAREHRECDHRGYGQEEHGHGYRHLLEAVYVRLQRGVA